MTTTPAEHQPGCTLDPVHWLRHALAATLRLLDPTQAGNPAIDRLSSAALMNGLEHFAEQSDWRLVTMLDVTRFASLMDDSFEEHCTCVPRTEVHGAGGIWGTVEPTGTDDPLPVVDLMSTLDQSIKVGQDFTSQMRNQVGAMRALRRVAVKVMRRDGLTALDGIPGLLERARDQAERGRWVALAARMTTVDYADPGADPPTEGS